MKISFRMAYTTLMVCLLSLLAFMVARHLRERMWLELETSKQFCESARNTAPNGVGVLLRDLNRVHVKSAIEHGISTPLANRSDPVPTGLIHVQSLPGMQIADMDYSQPYFTPEAAEMLREIGTRFSQNLEDDALPSLQPFVTSGLRTMEDQRLLRGSNSNAARTSAHMYGTTFDIAYDSWYPGDNGTPNWLKHWFIRGITWGLRRAPLIGPSAREHSAVLEAYKTNDRCVRNTLRSRLREVLNELRSEGRVWVLEEHAQPCFHITVREDGADAEEGG